MNREHSEHMKKMSEADKEMELRANRAKALLAERHIGLKTNQVSVQGGARCEARVQTKTTLERAKMPLPTCRSL